MNRNSCSASNELRLASCAWSRRYRMTSSLPQNRGEKHLHLIPFPSRRKPRRNIYFIISRPWLLWNQPGCFSCVSAAIYSPHPPFRSCFFTAPFFIFVFICFFGCSSWDLHGAGGVSSCFHALHFPHSLFFFPLLFLSRVPLQGGVALIAG